MKRSVRCFTPDGKIGPTKKISEGFYCDLVVYLKLPLRGGAERNQTKGKPQKRTR